MKEIKEIRSSFKKRIVLITVDYEAGLFYKKTFEEFCGAGTIDIILHTSESFLDAGHIPYVNLYLASTNTIEYLGDCLHLLPLGVPLVDIGVAFKKQAVETISHLPVNSKCMFVNATEPLALECMVDIYRHNMYNVHLTPFYPGAPDNPDIDIAITAGERRLVPSHVHEVYDMGMRYPTPQTLVEVSNALNMDYLLETEWFHEYEAQFCIPEQVLVNAAKRSLHYKASMNTMIESIDEAIIGINEEDSVFCINQKALAMFSLERENCIGHPFRMVLPFFPNVDFSEKRLEVQPLHRTFFYDETALDASINPIVNSGSFRGYLISIQRYLDAEDKLQNTRRRLLNKGHTAKYTFDDIIHASPAMDMLCRMAKRMAATNAAILINGESGTGKELLASAIHNASPRARYPYIAINCAAMPESLLESELFGYEEGAFSGARKNGKPGLFEHAHRGTLFLDEIEDMSPALQAKLLRVLQEKEVMRVGGMKLINVDVRIIAATNVDLETLMKEGRIRKDLYYRLNTMQLELLPLRKRMDDLPLLIEHFKRMNNFSFEISDDTMKCLKDYYWDGNVRELQNCIEYLQCLDKQIIQPEDLPKHIAQYISKNNENCLMTESDIMDIISEESLETTEYVHLTLHEAFILQCIYEAYREKRFIGRRIICEKADEADMVLSENDVRKILKDLEDKGLVSVKRGKTGSRITQAGLKYIQNIT